ncbi:MAG: winged helix-turn-helix transcriptional regulator [Clostridiales bacterium]|nr:winged helix-turn-helix transcriptional regulator [Clostridiales bacterium]MBR6254573.1 winged helix-turn-helix transcriptional regulator [Clostridiales bacterium]
MASDKEVIALLQEFSSIHPLEFLQKLDVQSMGISNVLCFLMCADHEVTAGEISDYMNVSTARVAVLLKKMSDKGLIEKHADPSDARRVMVAITDSGKALFEEQQREILLYSGAVVDHFGVDKIKEFIESCRQIREIVDKVEQQEIQKSKQKHD